MMQDNSNSNSAFSPKRKVVAGILTVGAVLGYVNFFANPTVDWWHLVFPFLGIAGSIILLREKSFLSGAALALMSLEAMYGIYVSFQESPPGNLNPHELRVDVFLRVSGEAANALLVFLGVLGTFLLMRCPAGWQISRPSIFEGAFSRSLWIPSLVLAQILLLLTIRGPLVFYTSYGGDEWMEGLSYLMREVKGLESVVSIVMACGIFFSLQGYGKRSSRFYFTLVLVGFWVLFFRLLRGERGSVAGFILLYLFLYYLLSNTKYLKDMVMAGVFIFGFLLLQMWATSRHAIVDQGVWGGIIAGWEFWWAPISGGYGQLPKIERFPQAFWNLLDAIDLYELGIRRSGETYSNLFLQAIPEIVTKVYGIDRPIPEPELLTQYRPHGGDLFLVAEAFWNWGISGVIGLALFLGWLFSWIENFFRRIPFVFGFGYFSSMILLICLFGAAQGMVRYLQLLFALTGAGLLVYKGFYNRFLLSRRIEG